MQYAMVLEPNGEGGFIARFPDLPEVLTEGATSEEATANAADALEVGLLGRMSDGEAIPAASAAGDLVVAVPAQAAAKLAFYVAFRASGLRQAELARRLGKGEAEIRRMLDPHHATKLASLDDAIHALGRRLTIELEPA